jgi:hypothetical protein
VSGIPSCRATSARHLADALGVLPGVVVAEFGRHREALDDLDLRLLERARALADLGLEELVLALHLDVEKPRFEQRPDTQQDLVGLKRLADEILRAARERLPLGLRRFVGRQNQDGKVSGLGDFVQLPHDLESIEVRHVQVEEDQVRPVPDVQLRRFARIRRALESCETGACKDALEDFDIARFIVDDENPGVAKRSRRAHVGETVPNGVALRHGHPTPRQV